MTSIPCEKNAELTGKIEEFAEVLKVHAHTLGAHGLSEREFYQSGVFRGAIERLRGQFSATMREKRDFVSRVLNFMEDGGFIRSWESAGEANRHDYMVTLNSGRLACIELKGCLDGNNTNIFERPTRAQEFIIWSVCTNPGGDPQHNVWSGIHTRLSAEVLSRSQQVDGLIVWDWLCGTVARPCPKLLRGHATPVVVGPYQLPPPCIYLFPATIPNPRTNPRPRPHQLADVGLLQAFHSAFGGGTDAYLHTVEFEVAHQGAEVVRSTTIRRAGVVVRDTPRPTPIQRA